MTRNATEFKTVPNKLRSTTIRTIIKKIWSFERVSRRKGCNMRRVGSIPVREKINKGTIEMALIAEF